MERSEEDKVLRSPITVTLGGKDYLIEVLCIRDAREWRKKFAAVVGKASSYTPTVEKPLDITEIAAGMVCAIPDAMADLFFAYAKGLDREKIEAAATEAELAKAIEAVMEVAFPLLRSLTGAMGKLSR